MEFYLAFVEVQSLRGWFFNGEKEKLLFLFLFLCGANYFSLSYKTPLTWLLTMLFLLYLYIEGGSGKRENKK